MILQVLSHGTLGLAKLLIQAARFMGKETEAQRGEMTYLRRSGWGWGRNLNGKQPAWDFSIT